MLFIYMFVVTIVLVNLLIAQMSERYEQARDKGREVWLAERIKLFQEYKDDRSSLPAPLNILIFVFRDLPKLVMCIGRAVTCRHAERSNQRGWKLPLRGGAIGFARMRAH